jgi:hypothetical protein
MHARLKQMAGCEFLLKASVADGFSIESIVQAA